VKSKPFLQGRGKDYCRGCLGASLFSALDLGNLPIANELLLSKENLIETFPLHLRICNDCGLGQVADVVSPERIFRDYRYLSSMSSTFLQHASTYVEDRIREGSILPGEWILEIASNDGYLLKNFLQHNIKVIGVEPAENVAQISKNLGIETISEFFSSDLAKELLQLNGYPKLIVANNVMAHVPDLIDFIEGLSLLCGPDTAISVENPSIGNILLHMQFDTIYHEHYSYLTATTVSKLAKLHGLHLVNVEELAIHGGSNRYWLSKLSEENLVHESVERIIRTENEQGLFNHEGWERYTEKVDKTLTEFLSWLKATKESGGTIYGYGAAAKASTILNSIDVQNDLITAIADASLEKQGRFMPPHAIKIISPQALSLSGPTDVVIFPWNIKVEIAAYLREILGEQTRLWSLIPHMHRVGGDE
jgi:2-polyprenyl-3-methyl-5-hydroxy-6-metoxy-1,4-benzoquinol methylase